MNLSKITFLLITLFISASCSEDFDLMRNSVWVEDTENPGLPEYSEMGYNTFGIYMERTPIVSNDLDVPLKVLVTGGNTTFRLDGEIKTGFNNYNTPKDFKLLITLLNTEYTTFDELTSLHGTSIDLSGPNVSIQIEQDGISATLTVFEGELSFTSAKKLFIDNAFTEVIMAGTFNFKTFIDGVPTSFFKGRFDLGVNDYNFYLY